VQTERSHVRLAGRRRGHGAASGGHLRPAQRAGQLCRARADPHADDPHSHRWGFCRLAAAAVDGLSS
jgi:hypothetical protein